MFVHDAVAPVEIRVCFPHLGDLPQGDRFGPGGVVARPPLRSDDPGIGERIELREFSHSGGSAVDRSRGSGSVFCGRNVDYPLVHEVVVIRM